VKACACGSIPVTLLDGSFKASGNRACCSAEHVSIERLAASAHVFGSPVDGAEMLVLEGSLLEGTQEYAGGSWIRLPAGQYSDFIAGPAGLTVYLKTEHLAARAWEERAPC
jgi:hypothetical protein